MSTLTRTQARDGVVDINAPDPRRWAALAILLTGAFLSPLDFFIVNVAMPSIRGGLGASPSEVQLVISAYAVIYAVSLITGGRLGDLFGRKSVFLAGLAGFAVASALCGLAWSPTALIVARMLQALAAAAMAPQALASVHALFPPHERGRALSIYGVVIGLSSVAGQLLGGALVGADLGGLGWRLIFLINLPVSVVAFIAAIPLLRETRGKHRPRLDFGGVVLSSLTLVAFVLPLVEGRERGWPWWTVAMLLSTPVFFELFRRYELRLARMGGEPLVAMDVFRSPGVLRGLGATGMLYAMAAFFLTYAIYLQSGLGFTAFQAGLSILPFSTGFLVGSTFSPAIGRWLGSNTPSLGFALSATGLVGTAALVMVFPAGTLPPWGLLGPVMAALGLGMGTAMPSMVRVIVERVEPGRAGLVGGMVNSTLQVSGALAVAVLGGLFFTILGAHGDAATFGHAFAITLLAIAACHVLGALLAAGLAQRRPAPATLPAPPPGRLVLSKEPG
jgi:MFS family permease